MKGGKRTTARFGSSDGYCRGMGPTGIEERTGHVLFCLVRSAGRLVFGYDSLAVSSSYWGVDGTYPFIRGIACPSHP